MKTNSTKNKKKLISKKLVEKISDESWTYIRTVVDLAHEPVLILNKDLCVLSANEPFYKTFQVEAVDTEGKNIYELGNGQWNILTLRKLLEDILAKNTFFKGFEVIHKFPFIGHKVMILNARQIHFDKVRDDEPKSKIILLTIEDITDMIVVAETLTDHVGNLEVRLASRAKKLEDSVTEIEKEIIKLKSKEMLA